MRQGFTYRVNRRHPISNPKAARSNTAGPITQGLEKKRKPVIKRKRFKKK